MLNEEAKNNPDSAQATGVSETLNEEAEREETDKGNWRELFRTAFERARRQQKPRAGRQELGRDYQIAGGELLFRLRSGLTLLLGDGGDIRLKVAVAARALALLPSGSTFLDVSVPGRAVSGTVTPSLGSITSSTRG